MITVNICVGSSCYLRGAPELIRQFQGLIDKHGLQQKVNLRGRFCMEKCTEGVTIQIEEELITDMSKDQVNDVFHKFILEKLECIDEGGEG